MTAFNFDNPVPVTVTGYSPPRGRCVIGNGSDSGFPKAFRATEEMIGTGSTVTLAVALLPSLVAVIVTGPPAAMPVTVATAPTGETVATAVLLEIQVIVRPLRTFPVASEVVAVNATV